MQRPPELAGRRLEDIGQEELSGLIQQRNERARKTALTIGGTPDNDTGAGPSHWYENLNAKNSRAWMISEYACHEGNEGMKGMLKRRPRGRGCGQFEIAGSRRKG